MDPQVVLDKVMRLAKGDFTVFDEVKADATQTIPAVVIAVVSMLLFGLGGFLLWMFKDFGQKGDIFTKSVLLGDLFAIGLWFVWVFVAFALLTSIFKFTSDIQMLIRTMGYAAIGFAPGLLFAIPAVGFAFGLAAIGMVLLLTNHAIQSTTNAPADKVMIANFTGFLVWAVVLSLLITRENPYAPNVFLGWSIFK